MNRNIIICLIITAMLLCGGSCRNGSETGKGMGAVERSLADSLSGMMIIGREMITEVIVRPDTLGDPWEVEKVKGFDGNRMFKALLEQIYSENLIVYDCLNEAQLKPAEIKKMEKEFNSELSRIAKLQFLEDWYYDPAENSVVKKIKSVSFGYEVKRGEGLPPAYYPLFRVKMD